MPEAGTDLGLGRAQALDRADELREFRSRFVIDDPALLYMDGNSLGRLTEASRARLKAAVDHEWASGLVRTWNAGWFESSQRVGDQIGSLIGAAPGQVVACDSTSVNLFKLAMAALLALPGRKRILTDDLNFPSDIYILQGCAQVLGDRRVDIQRSADGILGPQEQLADALDSQTALLSLSHVVFKSGFLYDAAALTRRAHDAGALVLWDLSHAVGVVPIELDRWEVDLAVGCTYKYLNGGPGAPAFLYVRGGLQDQLLSPMWGWFGQTAPFAFDLDYRAASGIARFLVGTPPILSLLSLEAALETVLEAGIDRLRRKSMALTAYLVELAQARLMPLGFRLGSPGDPARRGSHVSLCHRDGYRINRSLIEEMGVLPDFREPDNLRLGLAPLYTTFFEVWQAVDRIQRVVAEGRHRHYPSARTTVT